MTAMHRRHIGPPDVIGIRPRRHHPLRQPTPRRPRLHPNHQTLPALPLTPPVQQQPGERVRPLPGHVNPHMLRHPTILEHTCEKGSAMGSTTTPTKLTQLIACPYCRATVTQACRSPSGNTVTPHTCRLTPRLCPCGNLPPPGYTYCRSPDCSAAEEARRQTYRRREIRTPTRLRRRPRTQ